MQQGAIERLRKLVERTPQARFGMRKKNRERLRKITENKLLELLRLPVKLVRGALQRIKDGLPLRRTDVVDAEVGIAIALLLHYALRGTNLVSTRVGKHLVISPVMGNMGNSLIHPKR